MITLSTTRCLMIIYAPARYDPAQLRDHATLAAERIRRFTGGSIAQVAVL